MGDAFKSIMRGVNEAIEHSEGKDTGVRVFKPVEVNVKSVREKTGFTQQRFASAFGISVKTLRHWEQGERKPKGPALVLLNAVAKDHKKLLELLHSPAKVA